MWITLWISLWINLWKNKLQPSHQHPPMSLSTKEPHIVRSDEIGLNRSIKLPALVNLMQDTAWNNTEYLGASVYDLQDLGLTWAIIRMKLSVYLLPVHRQKIWVETWPSGSARAFVYRDYRIWDDSGVLLAEATSTWIVLDFVQRRISRLPESLMPHTRAPEGCTPLHRAADRLEIPQGEITGEKRFATRWHDLDPNGHVNNMLYFQWALEALPHDILRDRQVKNIDLIIKAECGFGDTIISRVAKEKEAEHTFVHEIVQADTGVVLALARVIMQ
ncbi:MAG: thioesterase [Bacteroidia bacterium]